MSQPIPIWLIRHAPSAASGVIGQSDVDAALPGSAALSRITAGLARRLAGAPPRLWVSPLRRCRQTADALFPGVGFATDARLAEQSFGTLEGNPALPDLGPLPPEALCGWRPPGGESFADLLTRVRPALSEIVARAERAAPIPAIVVAHAGTIRCALAHAMGGERAALAAALSFHIAPLSLTLLQAHAAGWAIGGVNLPLDGDTP